MIDIDNIPQVEEFLRPLAANQVVADKCLLVDKKHAKDFLSTLDDKQKNYLQHCGFPHKSEELYYVTGDKENLFVYLFESNLWQDDNNKKDSDDYHPLSFAPLPSLVGKGYDKTKSKNSILITFFRAPANAQAIKNCLYGVGLGFYDFTNFKKNAQVPAVIFYFDKGEFSIEETAWQEISSLIFANHFCRHLINMPPNHLGPEEFQHFFTSLFKQTNAKSQIFLGDDLKNNFPLIDAVGKGSRRAPRLLECNWGVPHHKKICLIGKGVCFDSGGLNLKSAGGMWLMKKDMGGAAIALALAYLIIKNNLPYRLQLLLPLAENLPDGNSYRPSDILTARNGTHIEVGDTDAEGRLLLADSLAYGGEQDPNMVIDIATLTGAARVAVGTGISAFFCDDKSTSNALLEHGNRWHDYMWPLPLHRPYTTMLSSNHADISSTGAADHYAGAITTALFLKKFVNAKSDWLHIDTMAWNLHGKIGYGVGGAAMSLLACYQMLKNKN